MSIDVVPVPSQDTARPGPLGLTPPGSWQDPDSHYLTALTSPWYAALLGLQSTLTAATVSFWTARGLRFGHLPVTTGSVSSPMGLGSDSLPVQVDLFGAPTYLADSMQFGLEFLCRLNPEGAYYLMPSFRGEAPDATHLCQFFHSEAEIPGTLDDVIEVTEAYLRHVVAELVAGHAETIREAAGGLDHVEALLADPAPFRRITFEEAVAELGDDPAYVSTADGWRTLTRAGERELMRRLGEFVWVTHWDQLAVPFYQRRDEHGRAFNGDLLFGPGEVVGAGERHIDGPEVLAALRTHEVDPAEYAWYVDMKSRIPLLTSGFGLGVERFFMWLLRQSDIRDFALLPRVNGRTVLP
ncbi:asparagine synthetase A [Kitasatospora sp. NPDC088346]|uniref:asparagine synthetase A n=1 Tax=Kitasatospora sp. NPDC088346 TaxID=3364073 RepID=UPI00382BE745